MTTYEMLDIAQSNYSNSTAYISICIAFLSGYLAAAYMVGDRFSRAQFVLVNSLYVILQSLLIYGAYGHMKSAYFWVNRGRPAIDIALISPK